MKRIAKQNFLLLSIFLLSSSLLTAQSTFEELYEVMQVKCTGCHGGASPQGSMDLSGNMTEVYNTLVNVDPVNPAALSKGYKRVSPGYVKESYLLHKIATSDWDDSYSLETADGDPMPPSPLDPLSKKEIELFRQWIMFGAPVNGEVVKSQILEDYYENGLNLPTTVGMAPPPEGEGYQLKMGPFFLEPLEEREFFIIEDLKLEEGYEVNRLEVKFNAESHHFILYKTNEDLGNSYAPGLRDVGNSSASMFQNTLVSPWQDEGEYKLPEGTAYKFDAGTHVDMNYHLKNYSPTGVLAAEVYLNIYTQPTGTAIQEMKSQLIPYDVFGIFFGEPLGQDLIIPNTGEEITFTDHLWIPNIPGGQFPSGTWHIWQLSSHTHARGVDYDIYIADAAGNKGEQIYEGYYNYDYTFNQGYYDWEHPAIRFFEPLLPVNMGAGGGLVHEAVYINDTDEVKGWGNTTDDEMMLVFIHYTLEALPVSTEEIDLVENNQFKAFPNPFSTETNISYDLKASSQVALEVYDLFGKKITTIVNEEQQSGAYNYMFNSKKLELNNGMYLVRLNINGQESTIKLVEMK